MPSRGKALRRRFSSRSIRRRRKLRQMETLTVYIGAVLLLIAAVFLVNSFFTRAKKIHIPAQNVAAFQIPYRSLAELKTQSAKYGVDFAEAVCLYAVAHDFFPSKSETPADPGAFLRDLESIRRGYRSKDIEPYSNLLHTLFGEIKYFPVPQDFDGDSDSYMYGDNWNKTDRCVDILDRENIRGRIPIVSMTAGVITELGWKEKTGYRIVIRTVGDTLYTYSRLDSFADGLGSGSVIEPGDALGYMGSVGSAPVRLQLSIAPAFPPAKDFYINPYPFLRLIEDSRVEAVKSSV